MKEFLFIFRLDLISKDAQPSPEKMQTMWKAWQDWLGSLAAQNKLGGTGKRLGTDGKVVKPNNVVTNGPYVELKEGVAGYMFVRADSIEEATELARGCPNLMIGGSVEVRPIVAEGTNA